MQNHLHFAPHRYHALIIHFYRPLGQMLFLMLHQQRQSTESK